MLGQQARVYQGTALWQGFQAFQRNERIFEIKEPTLPCDASEYGQRSAKPHCFRVANLLRSTSVSRYTAQGGDLLIGEQQMKQTVTLLYSLTHRPPYTHQKYIQTCDHLIIGLYAVRHHVHKHVDRYSKRPYICKYASHICNALRLSQTVFLKNSKLIRLHKINSLPMCLSMNSIINSLKTAHIELNMHFTYLDKLGTVRFARSWYKINQEMYFCLLFHFLKQERVGSLE